MTEAASSSGPEPLGEAHPLRPWHGRRAVARPVGPLRVLARPVELTFHAVRYGDGPALDIEVVRLTGSVAGSTDLVTTTLLTRDRQAGAQRRLAAGRWIVNGLPCHLDWLEDDVPPAPRHGNVSISVTGSGAAMKRLAASLTLGLPAGCLGAAAAASDHAGRWWPWALAALPALAPGLLLWRLAVRRYGGSLLT